jgi:predicted transcriptional regulator
MGKFEGTNFLDFKRELLKDSKERQEYERLKPKYAMIQGLIERRNELHLSQMELAQRIGMQQSAIARLESCGQNSTVVTLLKVADALDLDVEFKRKSTVKV